MDDAAHPAGGQPLPVQLKSAATLLAICTGLFSARVAAQFVQHVYPLDALPPFHAFQGSELPYATLLATQLLIVYAMARCAHGVARGHRPRRRQRGHWLAALGSLYLLGALLRFVVGFLLPAAAPWFRAWIPATFHVVLASFVLLLARHDLVRE
jgi:hypothetical protein